MVENFVKLLLCSKAFQPKGVFGFDNPGPSSGFTETCCWLMFTVELVSGSLDAGSVQISCFILSGPEKWISP